jgi:hypothetical protein
MFLRKMRLVLACLFGLAACSKDSAATRVPNPPGDAGTDVNRDLASSLEDLDAGPDWAIDSPSAVPEGGPEQIMDVPGGTDEIATDAPQAPVDLGGAVLDAMDVAVGSELGITPNPVTFTAWIGSSDTKTVNVTNNGASTSGPVTATLAGSTADFAIVNNECTGPLAPLASCTIEVVFKPRTDGGKVAVLSVLESGTEAVSVNLLGTVVTCEVRPFLAISPPALDFGTTTVGVSIGPSVFTVTNVNACPTDSLVVLKLDSVSSRGGASQFAYTTTCLEKLSPNETCQVAVTYVPTLEGSFEASILVTDGVAESPLGRVLGIARSASVDAGAIDGGLSGTGG